MLNIHRLAAKYFGLTTSPMIGDEAHANRPARLVLRNSASTLLSPRLFLGGLLLATALPAAAANCAWNTTAGNWAAAINWASCLAGNGNPAGVPGAADSAANGASGVITINTAQSALNLNNAGQINIDTSNLNLVGAGQTSTNSGTINVGSNITGSLGVFGGHTLNNNGGNINIANGSLLNQLGSTISGGTISTAGTGAVVANSNGSNILNGVTLAGLLDVTTNVNARERIGNGMTLNGNVNIANGGIVSLDSTLGAANSIVGTGSFNLNDPGARLALEGSGTTTLGASIVVRGQGNIGQPLSSGGTNVLVNNGRISADLGGATLNITPGGGSGSLTNNGVLDARNGGILQLSTSINNAAGQIAAQNASVVLQNGVRISGGTIGSSGSGVFRTISSAANYLDNATVSAVIDMTSVANSRERIINGATINGAINIANGGILTLDSANTTTGIQTIGGTAVINLNDPGARLAIDGNGSTTLGSGITVRGQGNIGTAINVGGTNTLTNNGLISADVAGGTLSITPPGGSGSFVNNGTLQAVSGGTLLLSTNVAANAGSQIIAGAGSSVVQNGVAINGVINASGTGLFTATSSGNNVLNAIDFTGTLDLGSIVNSRERIINGATLNGAINLGNGGFLSLDSNATPGGIQTISGSAVINLNDANTRLSIEGNGSTTLGAGITVRGQGNIGVASIVGGTNTLINNGLISADVAGGTLTITNPAGSGTLAGTGTLQTNGGTLNLATTSASTQGSLVMGGTGSALNLNTHNLTISSDYSNAGFAVGNAFDRRANVTGTGQILAAGDVAQKITGANVTGGNTANATLTIGNLHVGSNTVLYEIANAGTTGPALRGAIQTIGGGANISDARLSGAGVTAGNYGPVAAGNSTGSLAVNFNAIGAGALAPLSGQAVQIVNNFDNVGAQLLSIQLGVGAAAYNLAQGSAAPTPVTLSNQRVGGTTSQILTVTNTAPSGSFTEGLNASFGANTGSATNNGGAINLLVGQGSNNTAMSVAVNTSSAGHNSGTATLNYVSDGTGTSGLATTNVGSQSIIVSGNVYQIAQGHVNTAPLNFGTVQVGQNIQQALSISNIASGTSGFVEDLNASFGTSTGTGAGAISGSGAINGLAAAGSNSSNMVVHVNTAAAGTINGAIAINYSTAGAVNGISNGLGAASVGSESYGVSGIIQSGGQVVDQANPVINTSQPINLGSVRVGAASPTAFVSISNQPTGNAQAALNASIGGNAPVTASGSFNLLTPGLSNSSSLQVGMNTATAGAINGTATIALVSDASNIGGCGSNCQLNLASQTVNVVGKVFQQAAALVNTAAANFGIVHVGDSVAPQSVSVSNNAPVTTLNDVLKGSISANGPFSAAGSLGTGLAAGASSAPGSLTVGLNTAAAGIFNSNATLSFLSANPDMSDLALASQMLLLSGQVNNYAYADILKTGGAGSISRSGNTITLDLGTLTQGTGTVDAMLEALNNVAGLSDLLQGSFNLIGANDFNLTGFAAFSGLAAGGAFTGLDVSFDTTMLGIFTDQIYLNGAGYNSSGYSDAQNLTLVLTADVVASGGTVPEPCSLALVAMALAALLWVRRRSAV